METQITTAARRITRHTNDTPATLATHYDHEGTPVHTHEAGMHYPAGHAPAQLDQAAFYLQGRAGGTKLTQREAQDWLDAAARYSTQSEIAAAVTDAQSDREISELSRA